MKIVIDAMGSDNAPHSEVGAALLALEQNTLLEIILVGNENEIMKSLRNRQHPRLSIIHTDVKITGEDDAALAARQKPEASMVKAIKMVRDNEADAVISAGNTGAYLSTAVLTIGRSKKVIRPALASLLPTSKNTQTVALDLGANSESTAAILVQYAIIGKIIAQKYLQITNPKIGLLNNGSEAKKGTSIHKETHQLLEQETAVNFIGNIEGRDFASGVADVIVADGFSGNIALKTLEGSLRYVRDLLTLEFKKSFFRKVVGGLALIIAGPTLKKILKENSEENVGGAILAGVKKPVIKAHGNSSTLAFFGAIKMTEIFIKENIPNLIAEAIDNEADVNE